MSVKPKLSNLIRSDGHCIEVLFIKKVNTDCLPSLDATDFEGENIKKHIKVNGVDQGFKRVFVDTNTNKKEKGENLSFSSKKFSYKADNARRKLERILWKTESRITNIESQITTAKTQKIENELANISIDGGKKYNDDKKTDPTSSKNYTLKPTFNKHIIPIISLGNWDRSY
ncbi:unnamed protein product [Cunninghamella blakesleeana]